MAVTPTKEDLTFLELARKRFRICADSDRNVRQEELIDWQFRRGSTKEGLTGQWANDIVASRKWQGKPTITINRIEQFLRQVNNEQRQKRPSARVHPKGSSRLLREKAKAYQGIFREMELRSTSEVAYDTSFEQMTTGGRGYMRARTEYVDGKFYQDILIEPIPNPFGVYTDPNARLFDRTDAEFKFIVEDFTKEAMQREFPSWDGSSADEFTTTGDPQMSDWFPDGLVRVAEYFYLERTPAKLFKLDDGSGVYEDELTEELVGRIVVGMDGMPVSRDCDKVKVKWAKITGTQVLERGEFPGKVIPIWQVTGNEYVVDGHRTIKGMIRDARKAQECYNFWVTLATEMLMLAPRAPYLVVEGQTEGLEKYWRVANTSNQPTLPYKAVDVGGKPAPPPQRNPYIPDLSGVFMMIQQADNDLKACMGIYAASLGDNKGTETSGRAIMARQQESDTANANYADNFKRTFESMCKTLLGWFKEVLTEPQVRRIVYPDDSVGTVTLNQEFEDAGIRMIFDTSQDDCDVVVLQEPSYATKRRENADTMLELARVLPIVAQAAPDLIVGQMDFPDSQALVDRLRLALPPELRPEGEEDQNPIPPQVRGMLEQMKTQIQNLTKVVDLQREALDSKDAELRSKERIAAEKNQTDLLKTYATLDAQQAAKLVEVDLAETQAELNHSRQIEAQTRQQEAETMAQDAKMEK